MLTRRASSVCARAVGRSETTWGSRTSRSSSGWLFCQICSRAGRGCRWGRGRIDPRLSVRAIAVVKELTSSVLPEVKGHLTGVLRFLLKDQLGEFIFFVSV